MRDMRRSERRAMTAKKTKIPSLSFRFRKSPWLKLW
jgi:hypothetical protein